jgi:hypothetical protein
VLLCLLRCCGCKVHSTAHGITYGMTNCTIHDMTHYSWHGTYVSTYVCVTYLSSLKHVSRLSHGACCCWEPRGKQHLGVCSVKLLLIYSHKGKGYGSCCNQHSTIP